MKCIVFNETLYLIVFGLCINGMYDKWQGHKIPVYGASGEKRRG